MKKPDKYIKRLIDKGMKRVAVYVPAECVEKILKLAQKMRASHGRD